MLTRSPGVAAKPENLALVMAVGLDMGCRHRSGNRVRPQGPLAFHFIGDIHVYSPIASAEMIVYLQRLILDGRTFGNDETELKGRLTDHGTLTSSIRKESAVSKHVTPSRTLPCEPLRRHPSKCI